MNTFDNIISNAYVASSNNNFFYAVRAIFSGFSNNSNIENIIKRCILLQAFKFSL